MRVPRLQRASRPALQREQRRGVRTLRFGAAVESFDRLFALWSFRTPQLGQRMRYRTGLLPLLGISTSQSCLQSLQVSLILVVSPDIARRARRQRARPSLGDSAHDAQQTASAAPAVDVRECWGLASRDARIRLEAGAHNIQYMSPRRSAWLLCYICACAPPHNTCLEVDGWFCARPFACVLYRCSTATYTFTFCYGSPLLTSSSHRLS